MIRQYISLGVVLFIGVFIGTQIEWSSTPVRDVIQAGSGLNAETGEKQKPDDEKMSFSDLRTGGIATSSRRKASGAAFSPTASQRQFSAASSSPISSTSTAFRTDSETQTSYANARVTFSKLAKQADQTHANGAPLKAKAQPKKLQNSPENISSHIKISGHVVNDSGEPIKGLALTLKLRQASAEDKLTFGTQILNAKSDAKGAYSFVNLVEGEYQVCNVESERYKATCQSPRAPHSSADFSLHSVLGGRVHGIVKDEQGQPLRDVTVSATPGQKYRVVSDKQGNYSLKMTVNNGLSYQVYFSKDGYTRERVPVKGSDILSVKQLDVVLKKTRYRGFDVKGTIYDQSGNPVSGRTVSLYSASNKSAVALRGSSGPEGEFTIKYVVAAKDYRLNVITGGAYIFDPAPYNKMEIFDGMPPLSIQLQNAGSGSFGAHVVSSNGTAIKGETFSLYSGSAYVGRSVSDIGGGISFDKVPVKPGGSTLRLSGGSTPKYTFSGIKLVEGEHKSGIQLVVDRGDNNLELTIKDESQSPLQGAQGVLIWSSTDNGVSSQTVRSRGKLSRPGTGIINFSELGQGAHQLQVRLKGYVPYSASIDINQQNQYEEVVLAKVKQGG